MFSNNSMITTLIDILDCNNCSHGDLNFSKVKYSGNQFSGSIKCKNCNHEYYFDKNILHNNKTSLKISKTDKRNQYVFPETWKIAPENYNLHKYSEEFDCLREILKIQSNELFLDAGCGSGRLMELIAEKKPKFVIFCDVSDSILLAVDRYMKFYKSCFPALFIKEDYKNLPLKNNTISNSMSIASIHHTEAQDEAIKSILNATTKSFTLCVVTEKKLIGKIWIKANLIKFIINRIGPNKLFIPTASLLAFMALFLIKVLHYTKFSSLIGLKKVFANVVHDKVYNFQKIRYNMLDLLTAPFYIKHNDSFYINNAKQLSFKLEKQLTSSSNEYFLFKKF